MRYQIINETNRAVIHTPSLPILFLTEKPINAKQYQYKVVAILSSINTKWYQYNVVSLQSSIKSKSIFQEILAHVQ